MLLKNAGLAAAAAAAVGAGVLGATTIADAASSEGAPASHRYGGGAEGGAEGGGRGAGRGGGEHTDVTGAELSEVTDAVTAHDATITVESVRKDADGSYDVDGTGDGTGVRLEVSADLATITEGTGHGPGRDGGRGSADTPVTGADLTTVTEAVAAHDATLTVESVRQDPDGTYDVLVTRADGSPAMLEVSADLGTFTEHTGRPGHGRHGHGPDGDEGSPDDEAAAGATSES